jgi:hypothetical protein
MKWHLVHELVSKHVFRVETQNGVGTGFLFGYNKNRSMAAIATAAHVVAQAHNWRQPIRLVHNDSRKEAFLQYNERVLFLNAARDSASILVPTPLLPFEPQPLKLVDPANFIMVGVEIAWMGFPSVAYPELCLFTGCVSAFLLEEECYLIDGVAINGVSGGPVFAATHDDTPELMGIVSAYLPNRTGNTPGLLRAQDISPFHRDLQWVHSFEEAKEKEKEARQKALEEAQQSPEKAAEPPNTSEASSEPPKPAA